MSAAYIDPATGLTRHRKQTAMNLHMQVTCNEFGIGATEITTGNQTTVTEFNIKIVARRAPHDTIRPWVIQLLHVTTADAIGVEVQKRLSYSKDPGANGCTMMVNASTPKQLDPRDFMYFAGANATGTSDQIRLDFSTCSFRLGSSTRLILVVGGAPGTVYDVSSIFYAYAAWPQTYKIHMANDPQAYAKASAFEVEAARQTDTALKKTLQRAKGSALMAMLHFARTDPGHKTPTESGRDGHYWPYGTNRFPSLVGGELWAEIDEFLYAGMNGLSRQAKLGMKLVETLGVNSIVKSRKRRPADARPLASLERKPVKKAIAKRVGADWLAYNKPGSAKQRMDTARGSLEQLIKSGGIQARANRSRQHLATDNGEDYNANNQQPQFTQMPTQAAPAQAAAAAAPSASDLARQQSLKDAKASMGFF